MFLGAQAGIQWICVAQLQKCARQPYRVNRVQQSMKAQWTRAKPKSATTSNVLRWQAAPLAASGRVGDNTSIGAYHCHNSVSNSGAQLEFCRVKHFAFISSNIYEEYFASEIIVLCKRQRDLIKPHRAAQDKAQRNNQILSAVHSTSNSNKQHLKDVKTKLFQRCCWHRLMQ